MAAQTNKRFGRRQLWRRVHLWITLIVGLPVSLIAVTGLPVTYWYETDALFSPDFFRVSAPRAQAQSADAMAQSARAYPGVRRVDSIYQEYPGAVAIVTVKLADGAEREIAIDPVSPGVKAIRDRHYAAIQWLYSLHTRLLLDRVGAGKLGQILVVILAFSTVALVVTGVGLWWPGRLTWKSILPKIRRRTLWRDIHVFGGLYTSLVIAIAAVTAVLLSFPQTRSVGRPSQVDYPRARLSFTPNPSGFLERVIEAAMQASPGKPFVVLEHIEEEKKPYLVGLGTENAGYRWVELDRTSGAVTAVTDKPRREQGAADPSFLIGWHQGHRFGAVGRAIWALSSVLPILLYGTGLFLWLRRSVFLVHTPAHGRSIQ